MTKMKTHSSPSQEAQMLQLLGSGQMAEAISRSASHHQPGTTGRKRVRHCRASRHVVLCHRGIFLAFAIIGK